MTYAGHIPQQGVIDDFFDPQKSHVRPKKLPGESAESYTRRLDVFNKSLLDAQVLSEKRKRYALIGGGAVAAIVLWYLLK